MVLALLTQPRFLGHWFTPVSFWMLLRGDALLAVIVEVNNTFGQRHSYLCQMPDLAPITAGDEILSDKVFHVSPFCPVEGGYRFEFQRRGAEGLEALSVRVDYDDALGPLVLTGVGGRLQPLTAATRRHALWRYPCMTLAVTARIHWHALRLWLKRVPFYRKPPPPLQPVTRSTLHR